MAHNPEHTRLRGASGLLPLTEEEKREFLALEGIYDEKLGSDVSFGGERANIAPYLHPNMSANYPGSSPSAVAAREGFSTFPRGTTASAPLNLQGIQHNVVADAAKKANQYALQTAVQDRKVNQAAHQSDMTSLLMSMATGQRISSYGTSLRSGTSNTASNLAHQRRLKNAAISKGLVSIIDKYSDQIKSKKDVENLILAVPGLDIDQRKDLRAELNEWKEEDFKPMTAFVDGKIKVLFRRPGDLNKKEREAGYTFDMTITNALKGQGEAEMVGNALNKFSTYFSALPESERTRRKVLTWTAREGYYRSPVIMSAIRDLVGDLIPKPAYETRYFPGKNGAMDQRTVSSETPLGKGEVRSLEHAQQNAKTLHQKIQEEVIAANSGLELDRLLDMYRVRMQENPGLMALLEGTAADREQAFLNRVTAAQTQAATVVKAEADAMDAAAGVMTGGEIFSVKYGGEDGKTVLTESDPEFKDAKWSAKRLTKNQLLKDAQLVTPELTPDNGYYTREGAEKSQTWVSVGTGGERQLMNVIVDSFGNKIPLGEATKEDYGTLQWLEMDADGDMQRKEFNYSNPVDLAKKRKELIAKDKGIDSTSISVVGSDQDRYIPDDSKDWIWVNVPSGIERTTTDPDTGKITVLADDTRHSWEKRYTPKFATAHLVKNFDKYIGPLRKSYEQVNITADKIRGLIELEGELLDLGMIDVQLVTVFKKIDDTSMVTEQEFQTIKGAAAVTDTMTRAITAFKRGDQLTPAQRLAILKATQMVMIVATNKYRQRLQDANEKLHSMYPLMPSPTGDEISYQDILAPNITKEFDKVDQIYGYIDNRLPLSSPLLDRMQRSDLVNSRNRHVLLGGKKSGGAFGAKLTKQIRDPRGKLTTVPTTRPEKVQGF